MNTEQKVPLLGLSCREASRLISASLDRELSRRERWSLRLHTLFCAACRRFAQQTQMMRDAIAAMPDAFRERWSAGTATLSAERRAQIKRLLAEAQRADLHD